MIFEVSLALLTPILIMLVGYLIAPKNPNKHKLQPFLGGEDHEFNRIKYLYPNVLKYVLLFFVLDMFVFVIAISSVTNKIAVAVYSLVVILGVFLI